MKAEEYFTSWASINEIAFGILETERSTKRLKKEKEVEVAFSGKPAVAGKPLLYSLHIISEDCENPLYSLLPLQSFAIGEACARYGSANASKVVLNDF
jgi:hypothetical protein